MNKLNKSKIDLVKQLKNNNLTINIMNTSMRNQEAELTEGLKLENILYKILIKSNKYKDLKQSTDDFEYFDYRSESKKAIYEVKSSLQYRWRNLPNWEIGVDKYKKFLNSEDFKNGFKFKIIYIIDSKAYIHTIKGCNSLKDLIGTKIKTTDNYKGGKYQAIKKARPPRYRTVKGKRKLVKDKKKPYFYIPIGVFKCITTTDKLEIADKQQQLLIEKEEAFQRELENEMFRNCLLLDDDE